MTDTDSSTKNILCNMCGLTCRLELIGDNHNSEYNFGLIDAKVTGGYNSTGDGCLDDNNTYSFSLCEFCLDYIFKNFVIPPTVSDDNDGDTDFLPCVQRTKEDHWRESFREHLLPEIQRHDAARKNKYKYPVTPQQVLNYREMISGAYQKNYPATKTIVANKMKLKAEIEAAFAALPPEWQDKEHQVDDRMLPLEADIYDDIDVTNYYKYCSFTGKIRDLEYKEHKTNIDIDQIKTLKSAKKSIKLQTLSEKGKALINSIDNLYK